MGAFCFVLCYSDFASKLWQKTMSNKKWPEIKALSFQSIDKRHLNGHIRMSFVIFMLLKMAVRPKSLFYAITGLFDDRQATFFTFIAAKVSLPAFHPSLFFNDTQKSCRQTPVSDLPTNEKQGAFKTPCFFGLYNGACRVRTCDLLIKSQLLSQLS